LPFESAAGTRSGSSNVAGSAGIAGELLPKEKHGGAKSEKDKKGAENKENKAAATDDASEKKKEM